MISELLKNSLPEYEITLPVSNKKHKYRPMTVKEEKILLLAQDSKSLKEMANATVKILKNCFDIKNPEKLSIADAEKAFLELRAKSMGETVNFSIKTETGKIPISLDITTFQVSNIGNKTHKIKINEEMMLVLKDPEFAYLCEIEENEQDIMKSLFRYCFVELQTKTNVYAKNDVNEKDLDDFFDYMTSEQVNQFYEFVKKIPRMKKTIDYATESGENKSITLMGIDSFFVYASAT
jgi:hypothetical protein